MITLQTKAKNLFEVDAYTSLAPLVVRGLEPTYEQITIACKQTNSAASAAHKDDHTMGDSKESSDPVDSSDSVTDDEADLDKTLEWTADTYNDDVTDTPEVAVLTGIKWV